MSPRRGTTLLVALLLTYLAIIWGREFFLKREELPAFSVEKRQGIRVLLGEGFSSPGVHQFSDGTTPMSVMEMTGLSPEPYQSKNPEWTLALKDGERLDVSPVGTELAGIMRYWMPASQRMTLGIPLHTEQMSVRDWEDLPGIGPRLAQTIEEDRQRNGDFGSLEGLRRVKGVGAKRLSSWQKFFQARD